MCFCASASFAASGGLAVVGGATLYKSTKSNRLIAMVPMLFAVQQFIEGWQWLAAHPSPASLQLGYAFLFFAFLLWPFYIPLAVSQIEKYPLRKRTLEVLAGIGAVGALALLFMMVTQPLIINILPRGIDYRIAVPFDWFGVLLYVAVTCGSLFISSHRMMRWFGTAAIVSAGLSFWIYRETFTSVWCFFADILSVSIYFFISASARATAPAKPRPRR